jgi:tetratricopeptide (TPR) repeat protein
LAYAVKSYAKHGLHERAYNIASSGIKDPLNIADAYDTIGAYTADYDKESAVQYLDKSAQLLNILLESSGAESSAVGSIALSYISLASSYSKAGEYERSLSLKNRVVDDIFGLLSSTTNPTRFTAQGQLISSITNPDDLGGGLISELIEAGEVDAALDTINYAYSLIGTLDKGPVTSNPYLSHIMYLSRLIKHDRNIADIAPEKKAAVIENIRAVYAKMEEYTNSPETTSTNWMYRYAVAAGDMYWALGATDGLAFFNRIDPDEDEDSYYEAVFRIATEIAVADSFDAAIAFVETYNPFDDVTYSNVTSWGWGWIDGLTYYNDVVDGMGSYAYRHGKPAIAEAAADKAIEIIEAAAAYYITDGTADDELENLITYSTYALDNRYSEYGYLRVAQIYTAIDKQDKAKDVLDKALAFADGTSESFERAKAYAAIGHQYELAGYPAEAETAFNKAITLDVSTIASDVNKANHYIGLAYDATTHQVANKESVVAGLLTSAASYADAVGSDDNTYKNEINAFINIAKMYALILADAEIIESLEKAETAAGSILAPDTKVAQYTNIISTYAGLGFVDKAFSKATDTAILEQIDSQNAAIRKIAETVAAIDDFPESSIAFSDIDKDGKPDFFVPWASETQINASGLALDDDIDGDGIVDTADLTPFFFAN